MNYTSKEQSDHLTELGLPDSTSDMFYLAQTEGNYFLYPGVRRKEEHDTLQYYHDVKPCWSLAGLTALIPHKIKFSTFVRMWEKDEVSYFYWGHNVDSGVPEFTGSDEFDVAYRMVCWLIENKYIKFENNG